MFGRWFGKPSLQAEDRVWMDAAACERGLHRDVIRAVETGHAVLVLQRSSVDLDTTAHELAARRPRVADDGYAATDLRAHLTTPGALGVARVDALRPVAANPLARAPLQIHVRGRDPRRSADACLLELLKPWAPAAVVFHHALDDALLRPHTSSLKPLLQSLQFQADECITSPLLSRAIERAQQP